MALLLPPLILLLAAAARLINAADSFDTWPVSFWTLDYSHGLIRRGLAGAAVRLLSLVGGGAQAKGEIALVGIWIFTLVPATALLAASLVFWIRRRMDAGAGTFLAVMAISPLGIGVILYDKGRFDWMALCIVLLPLLLPQRTAPPLAAAYAGAGGALATLLHEAFPITLLPVVLCLLMVRCARTPGHPNLAVAVGIIAGTAGAETALLFLAHPQIPFIDLVAQQRAQWGDWVNADALRTLYRTTAGTFKLVITSRGNAYGAIQLAACAAQVWLWTVPSRAVMQDFRTAHPRHAAAVRVAWLSMGMMFFIGHDYVRWASLMICASWIIAMAAANKPAPATPGWRGAAHPRFPKTVAAAMVVCAVSVFYTNISVLEPFSIAEKLAGIQPPPIAWATRLSDEGGYQTSGGDRMPFLHPETISAMGKGREPGPAPPNPQVDPNDSSGKNDGN